MHNPCRHTYKWQTLPHAIQIHGFVLIWLPRCRPQCVALLCPSFQVQHGVAAAGWHHRLTLPNHTTEQSCASHQRLMLCSHEQGEWGGVPGGAAGAGHCAGGECVGAWRRQRAGGLPAVPAQDEPGAAAQVSHAHRLVLASSGSPYLHWPMCVWQFDFWADWVTLKRRLLLCQGCKSLDKVLAYAVIVSSHGALSPCFVAHASIAVRVCNSAVRLC